MLEWPHFTAAAACLLILIVVFILRRRFCHRRTKSSSEKKNQNREESLRGEVSNSSSSLFNWGDHPSLVFDGWSRFAFSGENSSAANMGGRGTEIEFSWEKSSDGITDFMQKIKMNPGLKKTKSCNLSVIIMVLPLPGPLPSFPQEAYFEITILSPVEEDNGNGQSKKTLRELMMGDVHFSVGLTRGRGGTVFPAPAKNSSSPGNYPGSIGFNSNGSIYLNGIKITSGSRNNYNWKEGRVIGCGYNPHVKEVLFTLDSELVQVIQCKSEEFGSPLYPIVVSDTNVTILVNLGQMDFKYAPGNCYRRRNTWYENSREMFPVRKPSGLLEFDTESESDLFEIVLDKYSRINPTT